MNKIITFFALCALSYPILNIQAETEACDRKKLLSLMAKKRIIDLADSSVCVDMKRFPNIRLKMDEEGYALGKNRNEQASKKRDESVRNIVNLLNNGGVLEDGKKFKVIATGVADGTFKDVALTKEGKEIEKNFITSISDPSGKLDPANVLKVIGAYDPVGAAAINKEIAKRGKVRFNDIPETDDASRRIKSMIRNSILAKGRGDSLCHQLFPNGDCNSSGQISPELETGQHNGAGCCEARRGAMIEIVPPASVLEKKESTAAFQPDFRKTTPGLQAKLNLSAALSVFQLPIPADRELEDEILEDLKDRSNNKVNKNLLKKDKERFAKALAGTGCEGNQFAIDSVRRIYWQVKLNEGSNKLMKAVTGGDFEKVHEEFEKRNSSRNLFKEKDKDLLAILSTGGNAVIKDGNRSLLKPSFHPDASQIVGGMPTDAFNCLDASKGLEHELKSKDHVEANESGVPFCQKKPKNFMLDKKSISKHICGKCKSGVTIKDGKQHYTPRQGNKESGPAAVNQSRLALSTFENANQIDHPLSMASMKHYRSYVIPNCGTSCVDACKCLGESGLKERLKTAKKIDYLTSNNGSSGQENVDEEATGQFSCIFTPPIPDTCSVSPMGGGKRDDVEASTEQFSCPLEKAISDLPAPKGGELDVSKPEVVRQLDDYSKKCEEQNFPASESACKELIKTWKGGNKCFDPHAPVNGETKKPSSSPSRARIQ